MNFIFLSNEKSIFLTFKSIFKFLYYYLFFKKNIYFIDNYLFWIKYYFNPNFDWCKYTYYLPNIDYRFKKFINNYLNNKSVMFDIWSNIWNWSLIWLKNNSDVHIFEPNEKVLTLFKINCLLNNYELNGIKITNGVVSDKPSECFFINSKTNKAD